MKLNDIYKRDEFVAFLKDDFLPGLYIDIRNVDQRSNTKTIENAKFLGECPDLDLQVFELETSGKSEKKIAQALDSFKLLKEYQSYRTLVAYHSNDDQNWRFALLQMTPNVTEKGKIATKFSNPRRYSFLLGPQAKIKTPEKYLIKDGKVKDFEDLQRRFSVEVVNKDFYREIARFFIRLVGGDTKLGSKTEHFKPELNLPSVNPDDHKTYQEYTVRLIGRIIFCWFLKQKKSQEGISLLPEEFLSSEAVKNTENYYHTTLEPVFFEVLNKPRESRKPQFRNGYDKIPYLNGGLFDPHYDDFYEGQPSFALKIPNDWFRELFEVLETYNFTIDENISLDVDLSIDPEMLGRIFENLLAEINPETGESARKSTGSYYTPRQIVEYMVDQSLTQYLQAKTGISKPNLDALVSIDESDDEQFPLNDEERHKIVGALDEVKIIDPACGSGAFPIGILQKIVWILGKVDINGKLWFDKKLEGLDPLLHEDFKQKFQNENFDYIRKTGVIRDSIYGVDLQPIAVEVSKLRSFLTLIVDEDIDETKLNRGIKPLPNLEFKFVSANSLISLPESSNRQVGMFEDTHEIEQLKKLRDTYFVSNGFDKEKIKSRFKDVQREMFKNQVEKGGHGKLTMALADWDPFSNQASDWFDPEWMFGLNLFDIVIANPPYVEHKKLKQFTEIFKEYFETYSGTADLYVYFYELGINLLKTDGVLTFITSNKFFKTSYGINLRDYLGKRCLKKIIDFADVHVFEALVASCVLVVRNCPPDGNCTITTINDQLGKEQKLEDFIDKSHIELKASDLQENIWHFESKNSSDLKDKIDTVAKRISQISGINIFRGVTTGFNPAFIIDGETRDKLLGNEPHSREIIKPLIQGRNIRKWAYTDSGKFLIFTKQGIDIEEYAGVKEYLEQFKDSLLPGSGRKMGKYNWYEIQDNTAYAPEFDKEKIVWGLTADKWAFAYDSNKHFLPSNGYILTSTSIPIKYLLGVLNSKLLKFYFKFIGIMTAGGAFTLKHETICELPVLVLSDGNYASIIELVDNIHSITSSGDYFGSQDKQLKVQRFEQQIDREIYRLYGLTETEKQLVEESTE